MAFGTLSLTDLLEVTTDSIYEFGEDEMFDAFELSNQVHNELLAEKVATFVEPTTDIFRRHGTDDDMVMERVDEFGRVDVQKTAPTPYTYGFPLEAFQIALQWTRKYFQVHTPAELAAQFLKIQDADTKNLDYEIRKTLFTPTNYSFIDRLYKGWDIPVKALYNADGMYIPIDTYGNTFNAATHTHYLANTTLTEAAILSLLETVIEHNPQGQPMLWINRAQEAAIRLLAGKFTAYTDARLVQADNTIQAVGGARLDMTMIYDRAIGIFDAAEVWVKPWLPAGYLVAWVRGAGAPLVMRTRTAGSGGLVLDYENEEFPLRARAMGREFGLAVGRRANAAILYIGGASYVTPTLVL